MITPAPTNTTSSPSTTTAAPTNTTASLTNTTAVPIIITTAPTTKTASPTTITIPITMATASTNTSAPTNTKTDPTTIPDLNTTTAAKNTTTALAPTATTTSRTTASTTPTTSPTTASTTNTTATPTHLVTTTTTTTKAPPPVFVVAATVIEPFVEELNNRDSQQFKALEIKVIAVYDIIYREAFGIFFIRSFIIAFRPAIARSRMNATEAEVGVEFNQSTPAENIPKAEAVQEALVQAVSNPNITLNISFEVGSIQIIRTPETTVAPTLNTTLSQNLTAATINPESSAGSTATTTTATTITSTNTTTTTTTTATTTTTTTTTITTAEQTVTRRLRFRSAGETFTTDLLTPSSSAFTNRAELLKSTLVPLYKRAFSSFRDLTVISFSNGSIINNMDLRFASASVPTGSKIAEVLVNAASQITSFNIDTTNIFVDGTQVSSGVNHKISLITAFCMVLLSWLLSSQHYHLC
ncbi:cell wall integrity and stress response component 4-like [Girardinichthys multiradiatus]|uniref:cell wall integrity and stress response component 4-like n=1 Tax=Girardinichthys multiradiatus TaxID=208333 RepID=UPI001FAC0BC4|nr:cell wall integrity and stress response component 4-like [Girardinichthys multiradiatus]